VNLCPPTNFSYFNFLSRIMHAFIIGVFLILQRAALPFLKVKFLQLTGALFRGEGGNGSGTSHHFVDPPSHLLVKCRGFSFSSRETMNTQLSSYGISHHMPSRFKLMSHAAIITANLQFVVFGR